MSLSFVVENWVLILAALVSGSMLLWPTLTGAGAVSPADAVRMINHEKAVLIDVCDPAEYAAGHVAGARSVPLAELASGKGLPANKALPVVVVCASGVRSSRAVAQLRKAGYEKARSLAGGTVAWRAANLPIEKSG